MKKWVIIFLTISSLSFSILMNISNYKVIGNSLYNYDKKIGNVDIKTFEIVGLCCAKDKNNVYFGNEIVKSIDTKTFTKISGKNDNLYYKDKDNIYFAEVNALILIKDADLDSFVVYDMITAEDKNNKYFRSAKLTDKIAIKEWNERKKYIEAGGMFPM